MDIGVISVRYARALLKSALDAKQEDTIYGEMLLLAKSYVEVPQLRQTIDNPMLSKETKQSLLTTASAVRRLLPSASPSWLWCCRKTART